MKLITQFDPGADLIIVEARIRGPRRVLPVKLALDTGSMATVVVPDLVEELGYGPRDSKALTSVTSAVGKEYGYLLRVSRFTALGHEATDFTINVFELANSYGLDGLIGLNFLEKLNYEIRSAEGRILAEKVELF